MRVSSRYPCQETDNARSQLDKLAGSHAKFNDLWIGIVWLVVRDPDVGATLPGKKKTYVLVTSDFLALGLPTIRVIYGVVGDLNPCVEFIDVT